MQTNPINNTTISTNGSLVIQNYGDFETICEVLVAVTGIPTGTNPTLNFTVDFSDDGINYSSDMAVHFPTITGNLSYKLRQVIEDILEKFIRISWTVSSGATFSGVSVWLNGADSLYSIYLDGKTTA